MTTRKQDGLHDVPALESLKALITQVCTTVERKFQDTQQTIVPCRLVIVTNHPAPLPVPPEDRRFFCLETRPNALQDPEERDQLVRACVENGHSTAQCLFHYLTNSVNTDGFEVEVPPPTKWRYELEHRFQDAPSKFIQKLLGEDTPEGGRLDSTALRNRWDQFRRDEEMGKFTCTVGDMRMMISSNCGISQEANFIYLDDEAKERRREIQKRSFHSPHPPLPPPTRETNARLKPILPPSAFPFPLRAERRGKGMGRRAFR